MTINTQQLTINKNQEVRIALTGRLVTGFLPFKTLNQRVAGSNPARLTIIIKGLGDFSGPFFLCELPNVIKP